ncbi:MAG: hypothetical protein OXU75_20975 [Deltaproteobacteria bacterium]|nr:hypothetical protein [Deltaproteobacteria bacterium]
MGKIKTGGLITLVLVAIAGFVDYGNLKGRVSVIERQHNNALARMSEAAQETEDNMAKLLTAQTVEFGKLLAGVIVLTVSTCDDLGPDWRRYDTMDGRFPLGAGQTKEQLEGKTTFKVGEKGGAYVHRLTELEMPNHTHSFKDRYLDGRTGGGVRGDDDDKERHYTDGNRTTKDRGGGKPHNNMPPYLVVNYCQKVGKSS